MKKIIMILLVLIFLASVYVCAVNYLVSPKHKMKTIFDINSKYLKDKEYGYKTEPSFNGDGYDLFIYKLKANTMNKIKNSKFEQIPENFYDMIIIDDEFKENFKNYLNITGFYALYDTRNKTFISAYQYFYGGRKFKTEDYILILLNEDNNTLIYIEYHN